MKTESWIRGMRMGNMAYIKFNSVFDKGPQRGQEVPHAPHDRAKRGIIN